MLNRFIENIVGKGIIKGTIPEEEKDIYLYGYRLMLEKACIFSISVILACVFGALIEMIIFYVAFIPLRSFAGGYHAKSSGMCMLLSTMLIIAYIVLTKLFGILPGGWYICLTEVLITPAVWWLAPVEHVNKPLSAAEKKCYGRIVKSVYFAQLIWIVILLISGIESIAIDIAILHGVLLCSVAAGRRATRD